MKRLILTVITVFVAFLLAPVASAQPGNGNGPTHGCDQALENDGDPYDSTCDGSASQNGKGDGNATGKPCAGCVGAADNKNPKGQLPDGSDHNKGYECDENQGVGKTNPAHTGCDAYVNAAPAIETQTIEGSHARAFDPMEGTGTQGDDDGSMTWGALLLVALAGFGILAAVRMTLRRRISQEN